MKYHNFDKLSDVLMNVAKQSGLDAGISQTVLFNLWSETVGNRFKKTTKAVKIHNKILTVATKSPSVTQELSMFKMDILKKLDVLTQNLDIKIKEIIFNHKIWDEINKNNEEIKEFSYRKYLPAPSDADLAKIELPQKMKEEIENSFVNTQNLPEEVKQKIIKTVSNDIKCQIWKKERNYPVCRKCFMVLDFIDEGKEPICPVCSASLG